MADKMNPEVKAMWLDALRSGEYEQTVSRLRDEKGYCCLGVLCDLHADATGTKWNMTEPWKPRYLGENATLPALVKQWAGLDDDNPIIGTHEVIEAVCDEYGYDTDETGTHTEVLLAAEANDGLGWTFQQIADAIEENL